MPARARLLSPLTLVAGAAVLLYASVLAGLAQQWYEEPATSHGVLLIAAAALIVRHRWNRLEQLEFAPHNGGFAILAVGMAIYAMGTMIGDLHLLRLSLPISIAGGVMALCGTRYLRLLLGPIGLLLLALPLPGVVVTTLTLPLQLMASQIAAGVLQLCQVPVVRHGNLLALQNITLEVADACNGLRSLLSLASVAAVSAALVPLRARRGALLIAAAVPIAVVGNGLRVAATGLLTSWIGEIAVRGILHELTGHVAFLMMCGAIVALLIATRPATPAGVPA